MSYIFGSEYFVKTYILDVVFFLFKFIFLGSHLAENLYFWINLAYNKGELNEEISNGRFSKAILTACCLPYGNVEHWKMSNLYFGYLLPLTFAKDYIFGSSCQKLGHALLLKLVSNDSPGFPSLDKTSSQINERHQ